MTNVIDINQIKETRDKKPKSEKASTSFNKYVEKINKIGELKAFFIATIDGNEQPKKRLGLTICGYHGNVEEISTLLTALEVGKKDLLDKIT